MGLFTAVVYVGVLLVFYVLYKKMKTPRKYVLSHLGIYGRKQLEAKLLDTNFELLEGVLSKNSTSPALDIIFPAFSDDQVVCLAKRLILKDIQNTGLQDAGLLFRSNTSSTVLWNIYCQRNGTAFLNAKFSDGTRNLFNILTSIINETTQKAFEVNPDFLDDIEDLNSNKDRLKHAFNEVLDTIIYSEPAIPLTMRKILVFLFSQVTIKFPQSGELAVGNFFFLRFICPCLLIPQQYNITSDIPSASAQRTLTLIAKMLQGLANQQVFQKKEEYLVAFNDVLESRRKQLLEFINKITQAKIDLGNEDFVPPASIDDSILSDIESKLKLLVKI